MKLIGKNWLLVGLLTFLAGGVLICSGGIQQKPGMANSRSEQAESEKQAQAVIVKFNRSIILGKVEKVKKDFPDVKLTVEVIRSQSVGDYANFAKEGKIIEIHPNYFGKGYGDPSFFKDKRNIANLQGYFFLPGDYFVAKVSFFGDERRRYWLYLNIQRISKGTPSKEVDNLEEFLKGKGRCGR